MESDDVLKGTVTNWFNGQVADFFDEGFQTLVPQLNKCLDIDGDYVSF